MRVSELVDFLEDTAARLQELSEQTGIDDIELSPSTYGIYSDFISIVGQYRGGYLDSGNLESYFGLDEDGEPIQDAINFKKVRGMQQSEGGKFFNSVAQKDLYRHSPSKSDNKNATTLFKSANQLLQTINRYDLRVPSDNPLYFYLGGKTLLDFKQEIDESEYFSVDEDGVLCYCDEPLPIFCSVFVGRLFNEGLEALDVVSGTISSIEFFDDYENIMLTLSGILKSSDSHDLADLSCYIDAFYEALNDVIDDLSNVDTSDESLSSLDDWVSFKDYVIEVPPTSGTVSELKAQYDATDFAPIELYRQLCNKKGAIVTSSFKEDFILASDGLFNKSSLKPVEINADVFADAFIAVKVK